MALERRPPADAGDELPVHLRQGPIDWRDWVDPAEEPPPAELVDWLGDRALPHWREHEAIQRRTAAAEVWCAERGRDLRTEWRRLRGARERN